MNDRAETEYLSAPVDVAADLDILFDQVRALRELGADPGLTAEDGRVYDFSIRWGTMMSGRLPRILHYLDRDALTSADRARFDRLATEFDDVRTVIERFRLAPAPRGAQPPVSPGHS